MTVGDEGCECFVLRSSDIPSLKISFPHLAEYVEKASSRRGYTPISPFVAEVPLLQKLQAPCAAPTFMLQRIPPTAMRLLLACTFVCHLELHAIDCVGIGGQGNHLAVAQEVLQGG